MIKSNLARLNFEKGEREGRKLTYEVLSTETGLSSSTITRLMKRGPVERVDGNTLSTLCGYYGVGVGDLLTYVPDEQTAGAGGSAA